MNEDEMMTDEYFDRFLICSTFGPPPEEIQRAQQYVAALRQARLDAERTLDETVTKLVRERTRATDAERERDEWERAYRNENSLTDGMTCVPHDRYRELVAAEAERDALAAAAGALLNHMGWSAADKGGYRTDKCGPFLSALAALLPSPASQEAVSDE